MLACVINQPQGRNSTLTFSTFWQNHLARLDEQRRVEEEKHKDRWQAVWEAGRVKERSKLAQVHEAAYSVACHVVQKFGAVTDILDDDSTALLNRATELMTMMQRVGLAKEALRKSVQAEAVECDAREVRRAAQHRRYDEVTGSSLRNDFGGSEGWGRSSILSYRTVESETDSQEWEDHECESRLHKL